MNFEIVGEITNIEAVAVGRRIRILPLLLKRYGKGRWRKLKGIAMDDYLMVLYDLLKSTGLKLTV